MTKKQALLIAVIHVHMLNNLRRPFKMCDKITYQHQQRLIAVCYVIKKTAIDCTLAKSYISICSNIFMPTLVNPAV